MTRITVPAGGATAWEVPTLTGMESVKEVEGVVVFWSAQRAYWKEAFAGAGVQPDCSSSDAVTGYGNPGGACADCELAKWGSAKTGKGQACKLINNVYIVQKDDVLPTLVALPATSVTVFHNYLTQLVKQNTPYSAVITGFSLDRVENKQGIAYSKVKMACKGILDQDTRAAIKGYAGEFKKLLTVRSVNEDEADE